MSDLSTQFDQLQPEVELIVRDSSLDLEGYVVVFNTNAAIGGPLGRIGKGGTRITPTTSLAEIRMLAKIMTLKNAAAGLPLGGAKSGICADPKAPDFEKKYRRFAQLVKPILAENGGPFGGFGFDIGGDPQHPIWICDELKSTRCFTGKPVAMGGTDYDREGIAGLGVVTAATTILSLNNVDPRNSTFAVQGVGAMGAAVVKYFSESGATLKYVSDPRLGGSYELPTHSTKFISLIAEQRIEEARKELIAIEAKASEESQILFQNVDLVFPCAVQDVITEQNQGSVLAKYVIEGANNPCSDTARKLLMARGCTVIPDFLANPGGIIAAYIELAAELDQFKVQYADRVSSAKNYTKSKIEENVRTAFEIAKQDRSDIVQAARAVALQRIIRN